MRPNHFVLTGIGLALACTGSVQAQTALKFNDDALDLIVDKAIEFKLGARGLRSLTESIMIDAMYEEPSSGIKEFTVTKKYASDKLSKANFDAMK